MGTDPTGIDRAVWRALEPGLARGDWERSLQSTRGLLVQNRDSAAVALGMGICRFHSRDFGDCIEWMDRASRLGRGQPAAADTVLPAAYLFRGLAYAAKRLPAAAKADLARLRSYGPTPLQWERVARVLLPDELERVRRVVDEVGLGTTAGAGDEARSS